MKYLLRNLIFFLVLFCFRLFAAEQTNIAITDSLTRELIRGIFADTELSAGDTVALQVGLKDHQETVYCQQLISQALEEKSLTVFRNYNRLSSFHGLVLEISRLAVTVLYSEPQNDGFLGESYTDRTIQVYLSGQLFNAMDGRVIKYVDDERRFRDSIPYARIEDLEASEFDFSRGKRQGYSGWEVYLEPFLVASSVVVVVLLFFTQRN